MANIVELTEKANNVATDLLGRSLHGKDEVFDTGPTLKLAVVKTMGSPQEKG